LEGGRRQGDIRGGIAPDKPTPSQFPTSRPPSYYPLISPHLWGGQGGRAGLKNNFRRRRWRHPVLPAREMTQNHGNILR